MEFVLLIFAMLNHDNNTVAARIMLTPDHQTCERLRDLTLAQLGPTPPNVEVRAICLSSEKLVSS